ncbi:hypothetical protein TKK_0007841 [Trichogramma kaykai]|uniref:SAP domain-containing protein n=1 Tax=Trichogramma kaykai TaxID=54128 RepID=A0ABD2X855_9HYME
MVTLNPVQKSEREHCVRRMCTICKRVKRDKALKVKLMLRRPYNQLVDQGIMPPFKSPVSLHEQTKQQERRKTEDMLKVKIQQRPGREELVRQHILEDIKQIDPSLAERRRMLKKAKLADQLNDQLSHRPGPLELIQKNILHTEEPIERAVKEGHIPFKATSEGQLTKPQHPDHYISFEDDSLSSEGGAPSPSLNSMETNQQVSNLTVNNTESEKLKKNESPDNIVTIDGSSINTSNAYNDDLSCIAQNTSNFRDKIISSSDVPKQSVPTSQVIDHRIQDFGNLSSGMNSANNLVSLATVQKPILVTSIVPNLRPVPNISMVSPSNVNSNSQSSPILVTSQSKCDAPGKEKNRKKSKIKNQQKARTIKFHEYKGPPNHQRIGGASNRSCTQSNETSYELLLRQQQLFLQWQVEFKNKYPQLILPATQRSIKPMSTDSNVAKEELKSNVSNSRQSNMMSCESTTEQPPFRPLGKLEDMKVCDLKIELKKRNLPVSGSKPQLIERLKPFTEVSKNGAVGLNGQHLTQMGHILMDTPVSLISNKIPNKSQSDEVEAKSEDTPETKENKGKLTSITETTSKELAYLKKIEELKQELSKARTQQHQSQQPIKTEKLVLQQHLQNKMQQQNFARHLQQLQQLQYHHNSALQELNSKTCQQNQTSNTDVVQSASITAINNKKNQSKNILATNNLDVSNDANIQVPSAIVLNLSKPTKFNGSILEALVAQAQNEASSNNDNSTLFEYDESANLLKVKIEPVTRNVVKSQMVDDVLEILISNGELPPSAAQELVTPMAQDGQQMNRVSPMISTEDISSESSILLYTDSNSMNINQSECENYQRQTPHVSPSYTASNQQSFCTSKSGRTLENIDAEIKTDLVLTQNAKSQSSSNQRSLSDVKSSQDNNLELKELELDLDTVDFGELGCEFDVKIENSHELMDIEGIPMEVDEPDWFNSLIPHSSTKNDVPLETETSMNCFSNCASMSSRQMNSSSRNLNSNDIYDPLLCNSQDADNFFNIEDSELKMSSELSLAWENGQNDFAS